MGPVESENKKFRCLLLTSVWAPRIDLVGKPFGFFLPKRFGFGRNSVFLIVVFFPPLFFFSKGCEFWFVFCVFFNEKGLKFWDFLFNNFTKEDTLQGTNISPKNGILKMIFLFPRWDMLIPWRVSFPQREGSFSNSHLRLAYL